MCVFSCIVTYIRSRALFISMLIQASNISLSFEENHVLSDISFTIAQNSRIGLVGVNGSGKTTILKLLLEKISPDTGDVLVAKGCTIGYVPQVVALDPEQTVGEFLAPYAERPYLVDEALTSLATLEIKDQKIGELSGGQTTKVYLARIALFKADVLLLDEPTNHLDLVGLDWLAQYVKNYDGAVVLVSHDRQFINDTVSEIFEIERGTLTVYGGDYSFYREEKGIQAEATLLHYESQQKEKRRLTKVMRDQKDEGNRKNLDRTNHRDNDKMAASYHADRSSIKIHSAAKNTESRIGRMDLMEKPEKDKTFDLYFKPSGAQNSNVVSIKELSLAFDALLLTINDLDILYGQRIALQGANGSGKTTLIKNILNHTSHDEIQVGPGVIIGYLSQNHAELLAYTSAHHLLTSIEGVEETDAYKILSKVKIDPEHMKQDISTLSSGQKTKLLLARIMVTGANFIILDEPTNHLDIEAIEVIEQALAEFKGTLLVISHDRYFLNQIGITSYLLIEDQKLKRTSLHQKNRI